MGQPEDRGVTTAEAGAPQGLVQRTSRGVRDFTDSYGLVFVMVVVTLLATATLGDLRWGRALTCALMGATLLLTLRASQVRRGVMRVFAVVVAAAVIVSVVAVFTGGPESYRGLSSGIIIGFVVVAPVAIIRRLKAATSITMRTVMGALCVYLFIGLFFAATYGLVEVVGGDPFFVQLDEGTGVDFIYYSFITQATVGYGDLTPATDLGRMLAITEALLGQVYLVTIVAALVSNIGRARPAPGLAGHAADAAWEPAMDAHDERGVRTGDEPPDGCGGRSSASSAGP